MKSIGPVSAVQLGTLVKVVANMHDVPTERLPGLKGRFRNFAKLGFPNVASVGTGSRAAYWPEHVAQVLVAFEMVRFRVPQSAAAHGVEAFSPVVEKAFGAAARQLTTKRDLAVDTVMIIRSNALLEDAKQLEFGDMSISLSRDIQVGIDAAGTVFGIDAVSLVTRAARAARTTDEPFEETFFTRLGPG